MKAKNMLRKCLFVGVFCIAFALNGRKGYDVPDSIKGVKINSCTISQLLPIIPAALQKRLDVWLADPLVQDMVNYLTRFSDFRAWQQDWDKNQALMSEFGYTNWSNHSYVSEIPESGYIFKLAGQKDRLIGMLATKGIVLSPEQQEGAEFNAYVARYLKNGASVPTYDAASSIAYYLLLKDRIKKESYRHLFVPNSYLVQLPGKPNTIDDGNVMIIQERVPGGKKLAMHPALVATIDDVVVKELFDAVVALGLWNIKENLLLRQDGSLCITCNVALIGLSERKNSSSKDFFHKNKQRFDENVYIGLVSLLNLFKDDAAKVAYIKKHICKDARLKDSSYHEKLIQLAK